MISYLNGKILNKRDNYLILKVDNVGYKVFVSVKLFDKVHVDDEKELYIHQQVGEQVLALYGVESFDELVFFELLILVSGIGPKTALGILAVGNVAEIQASILDGSPDVLALASGVGKKTAERAVLELRTKLVKLNLEFGLKDAPQTLIGEEIDALMALGYSMMEAREALKEVDSEIKDSSLKIKEALKNMGKK
ncbi:Holliday junction branch migration protein RuvA [Patescibacteria group bacterium]|nr:Holliday junction branch migration protein RuvA [Patescibacteria group bacterium]